MDRKERVLKTFHNEPSDKLLVGFWHHYLEDELVDGLHNPAYIEENLAAAKKFKDDYDPDFVKVMTDGLFFMPFDYENVHCASDLKNLKATEDMDLYLEKSVEFAKAIREIYGHDVLMFYNVFSPAFQLSQRMGQVHADKYAGLPEAPIAYLIEEDPEAVQAALDMIGGYTETMIDMILGTGIAEGMYFSVSCFNRGIKSDAYRKYVMPGEKRIIAKANEYAKDNLLHICGWRGLLNDLNLFLDVPIGLICNAIGGSTTESWIDRQTLETEIPSIYKDWLNNDYIQDWARKRAAKNIGAPQSGATRHPYEPSYLFESGVLQLECFPIKGVIWYQGESNAHNVELHENLFQLLIKSWRTHWNQPELPFYIVQLYGINRPSWPHFRDSQRRLAESIPFTGMAVSSDVGDSLDVHPKNKRPVGERLAKVALHNTYGFSIEYSGPTLRNMEVKGKKVVLGFDHAEGLTTSDGKDVIGFEVAGEDKVYYEASAEIKNDKVILKVNADVIPKYIRYAWKPFTRANLINGDGLPASTFEFKNK